MTKLLLCGFLLLWAAPRQASSAMPPKPHERCDIPGSPIKDLSTADAQSCHLACQAAPLCEAFTFISGWQRCFLRKQTKARLEVTMTSALRDGPSQTDHDFTGKDMLQKTAKTPHECGQLCRQQANCGAFTYIGGYNTCWLKKGEGKFRSKLFYCGTK